MRSAITTAIGALAFGMAIFGAVEASAQSSASTYSYGTYNPVQAAINRNTMNAAILRQATGKHARAGVRRSRTMARRRH